MNEQPKNQYASDLFRTQEDYLKQFNTKVDGDVYACTVPGTAVEPGWVVTDKDGHAYRRSSAIISGDPMALFIQLSPAVAPAHQHPLAHESERAEHAKHNKGRF